MLDVAIHRFSRWFASTSGVWQTFAFTFAVVVVEHIFPHVDPNGFLLLYWLTVYSGVTQNLLAYASSVSSNKSDEAISRMDQMLINQADMMRVLIVMAEKQQESIENIADDVEEIAHNLEGDGES